MIEKVLFITLSNMGDVVLTLPALDALRALYPQAHITVMVGPRPREIFEGVPSVDKLIVFDKRAPLREKAGLFLDLMRERFDAVLDYKNSFYGAFLPARYRTSPFLVMPRELRHMKERNLYRLRRALRLERIPQDPARTFTFSGDDKKAIDETFFELGVLPESRFIAVNPSAGGDTRRWPVEKFAELCSRLAERSIVVLIGSSLFKDMSAAIVKSCASGNVIDLTGKTTIHQLAYVCSRASLVVSADTGVLHIASYMDAPVIGLFGAGDERRYGPWSKQSRAVFSPVRCRPCSHAQCETGRVECMHTITVDDVMDAAQSFLEEPAGETKDG